MYDTEANSADRLQSRRAALKLPCKPLRYRPTSDTRRAAEKESPATIFEKAVSGSDIRLIELKGSFYIEDPRLPDTADMGEAFRYAESVLPELNALTKVLCPQFQPAKFYCMVELYPKGYGQSMVGFAMVVHGTAEHEPIRTFLGSETTQFKKVLDLCNSDKNVREALFYLGAEGNAWANLYKASEIVEDRVGGAPKAIFNEGWCSRSEWDRFRRTANHQEAIGVFSRHARQRTVPPPDPMTVEEAKLFISRLLKNWIVAIINDAERELPGRGD